MNIIGFEASSILKRRTGIGHYTYNVLLNMLKQSQDFQFKVFTNSFKDRLRDNSLTYPNARHIHSKIPGKLLLKMWELLRRPHIETLIGSVDLFHSTNNNPIPQRRGIRLLTVYDLYFLRHPENTDSFGGKYFSRVVPRYIHKWDHVITISQAMKEELQVLLRVPEEKITVIPCAIDPFFYRSDSPNESETAAGDVKAVESTHDAPQSKEKEGDLPLPQHYILAVGTLERRKNYPTLVQAFAHFLEQSGADFHLIIAGIEGNDSQRVKQHIENLKLGDRVKLMGYLTRGELKQLYRNAACFIMVSEYEGFGIPVLEAMASGTPVIASNCTSFPEVVQDAGLLVPPKDIEGISEVLISVSSDNNLREELIRKGRLRVKQYSWENAARQTLALYRTLLG